jgi:hypothetical protein
MKAIVLMADFVVRVNCVSLICFENWRNNSKKNQNNQNKFFVFS